MSSDYAVLVRQLLLEAGIVPSENEVRSMIAAAPARAEMVNRLYAVPEARYEEPALVFDPTFPV